jgi:3-hydroxyisobutyrate dehydrogenase-like beta-hydroxyacid dehydrogenase
MVTVAVVGLGNMGSAMAANLVAAGHHIVTHDLAGPDRSPEGATFVDDVADVAQHADVVLLSVPDADASEQIAAAVGATGERRVKYVVDTSTIGVQAAEANDALLGTAGVVYVDAPVSGGVAKAQAGILTIMYAGPSTASEVVEPVLASLSDRVQRVGDRPGMAQALKLANNFLSATALAATSEAIAFGQSAGLDMATMLDVLNASSGQSNATSEKFPNHVLTGRYAAGFANSLMSKDVRLYLRAVEAHGSPAVIGPVTASVWDRFAAEEPGADFTRIYPFVAQS